MQTKNEFQKSNSLESRQKILLNARKQNKIPVVTGYGKKVANQDFKILFPKLNSTFMELKYQIQKQIKLQKTQSLFFFTDQQKIIQNDISIEKLYAQAKDQTDELLYIFYQELEIFG